LENRKTAIEIFLTGVESVKPDNLINRFVSMEKNILRLENMTYDLSATGNIYIVGMGKASAIMARAIESVLGKRITAGHVITKYGHSAPLKYTGVTEAGHPVPDENGIRGTEQILSIVNKAGKDDLVICLISGGGSALQVDVPQGCTLEDLKRLNSILLKSGADITELNCIRKHISKVKGGQLAKSAYPAKIVSLILSDVIGDPLEAIASGPTAPDPTTFADAISILRKYNVENEIPEKIYRVLQEGFYNKRPETLKVSDKVFRNTSNFIIGNNSLALKTAKEKAEFFGYETKIISNKIDGDVNDVADYIVEMTMDLKKNSPDKKCCLLFSGEPTVKVSGTGSGGRNQHLALLSAKLLGGMQGITFLSGGTDGTDGPTDAAGAVIDQFTLPNARDLGLDIEKYLNDFDSYNFFKKEGGLIITGPTQTNVMDLMVVLINQSSLN